MFKIYVHIHTLYRSPDRLWPSVMIVGQTVLTGFYLAVRLRSQRIQIFIEFTFTSAKYRPAVVMADSDSDFTRKLQTRIVCILGHLFFAVPPQSYQARKENGKEKKIIFYPANRNDQCHCTRTAATCVAVKTLSNRKITSKIIHRNADDCFWLFFLYRLKVRKP